MKCNQLQRLSIIGTVGVPAAYGGFETLAENLVRYANNKKLPISITVYCSGRKENRLSSYEGAKLKYVPIAANGIGSVFYDIYSMFSSARCRDNTILVLGVSGALAIPLIRLFTKVKIITNIDGIEWKRDKWGVLAKHFLRISELVAVKFSHVVISDNEAIQKHVTEEYSRPSDVIAYGGDHALVIDHHADLKGFPSDYVFALCRIEPENNVEMILKCFLSCEKVNLVFIGNWDASDFGRTLKRKFGDVANIFLIDPIYDLGILGSVRSKAKGYVHGHSAGGTNPSLVEIMHFGVPVIAFDCSFNRFTTNSSALYFENEKELIEILGDFNPDSLQIETIGLKMKELATDLYTWDVIGQLYFDLVLQAD